MTGGGAVNSALGSRAEILIPRQGGLTRIIGRTPVTAVGKAPDDNLLHVHLVQFVF